MSKYAHIAKKDTSPTVGMALYWCGECRDLVRERGAIVTSEELIARSKEVKEQAVGRSISVRR